MMLEENDMKTRMASTSFMAAGTGCAWATTSEGLPGTVLPNQYKNQAKLPTDSIMTSMVSTITNQWLAPRAKPVVKMGYLLKKPLSGGTPVMASAATQKPTPSRGRRDRMPCNWVRVRVPHV